MDVPMAQHLLAAADMYQLDRLRKMCERRLCDSVDTDTVATTLALAEQNHAEVSHCICKLLGGLFKRSAFNWWWGASTLLYPVRCTLCSLAQSAGSVCFGVSEW